MRLIPLAALFAWWFACGILDAQQVFDLDSSVAFALTNNAELAASRLAIQEAEARVLQAGQWHNPELETEFSPNVRGNEWLFIIGFSQRFPITSRLKLEKKISSAEVAVARAEILERQRRLAFEVLNGAVHLAALGGQLKLKEKQILNNQELVRATEKIARSGEGSDLISMQLTLEAGRISVEHQTLAAEQSEASAHLKHLLGLSPESEIRINELVMQNVTTGGKTLQRPDYAVATARIAAAAAAVKLARSKRWEDAKFGFFAERSRFEDTPVGIQTEHMVGIRFSIPLPLWNKNQGAIKESEVKAERLEKEAGALAQKINSEIKSTHDRMKSAAERVNTIKEILLPKARQLEERMTRLQMEGRSNFTDFFQTRAQRLQLESDHLAAMRDYHLARARHLAAIGMILNTHP